MTHVPSVQRLGAVAAKSLLGLAVFVTTTVAWSQFGDDVLRHRPLPGARGPGGPCAVWFVGSSSIYRWSTMAQDMAPWIVHNRGVNGALAEEVASRLSVEEVRRTPGTIVFYIGENDIADGAAVPDLTRRLATLVTTVQRRMPAAHVDIIGLKPSPTRWASRPEQLRFNVVMADFARRQRGVSFLDIGDSLLVDGRPGPYYAADGIHLDARGYRVWGGAVRHAFEASMPRAQLARCTGRSRTGA